MESLRYCKVSCLFCVILKCFLLLQHYALLKISSSVEEYNLEEYYLAIILLASNWNRIKLCNNASLMMLNKSLWVTFERNCYIGMLFIHWRVTMVSWWQFLLEQNNQLRVKVWLLSEILSVSQSFECIEVKPVWVTNITFSGHPQRFKKERKHCRGNR